MPALPSFADKEHQPATQKFVQKEVQGNSKKDDPQHHETTKYDFGNTGNMKLKPRH
ncbi:MAG: hypothetical protein NPINA01_14270 [Nitrospinaceae bacterium]|nr:MAG: hypothetical protein NPINA01_14270 [Nitrospinaceae bacterium]